MRPLLYALAAWVVLSVPFGVFVGKFIKAGRGWEDDDEA